MNRQKLASLASGLRDDLLAVNEPDGSNFPPNQALGASAERFVAQLALRLSGESVPLPGVAYPGQLWTLPFPARAGVLLLVVAVDGTFVEALLVSEDAWIAAEDDIVVPPDETPTGLSLACACGAKSAWVSPPSGDALDGLRTGPRARSKSCFASLTTTALGGNVAAWSMRRLFSALARRRTSCSDGRLSRAGARWRRTLRGRVGSMTTILGSPCVKRFKKR